MDDGQVFFNKANYVIYEFDSLKVGFLHHGDSCCRALETTELLSSRNTHFLTDGNFLIYHHNFRFCLLMNNWRLKHTDEVS